MANHPRKEGLAMARTLAELPKGSRLTDFISLGVIAKWFPREQFDPLPGRIQYQGCLKIIK
jgi:hypothetical protein